MVLIFSAASVKRIRLPNMLNSIVWPGLVSSLWVHSKKVLFIRCFVAVTKRSSSNGAHDWTRGAKLPRALICLFLDTDLTNDEIAMNTTRHGTRTSKIDFFSCEMEAMEGICSQILPIAIFSESDVEWSVTIRSFRWTGEWRWEQAPILSFAVRTINRKAASCSKGIRYKKAYLRPHYYGLLK